MTIARPVSALLTQVIDAHGGMERWYQRENVTDPDKPTENTEHQITAFFVPAGECQMACGKRPAMRSRSANTR